MNPRPLTRSSKPVGNSGSVQPTGVLNTQKNGNADNSNPRANSVVSSWFSMASVPNATYITLFVSFLSSHSFICAHFLSSSSFCSSTCGGGGGGGGRIRPVGITGFL
ncbi:hypothetical protein AQUCO_01000257v1 [Aquilegia coerulea]|uniref:Uncharacterized protein n=1 Tax=Aquilegia coerulea TaxID=218851 RepID=A0A2G5E924_AQUCA|nr:hypothetical protein AQUCO_01000257v1 [Aquilegia coerulea]